MCLKKIICFGNDILGDDGISFHVGKLLSEKLNIKVHNTNTFGFNVVNALENVQEAIIIDAVVIESIPVGEVFRFDINYFDRFVNLTSPHTFNFPTALKILDLYKTRPEKMYLYGINIGKELRFSESISKDLFQRIDKIANDIYEDYLKNLKSIYY